MLIPLADLSDPRVRDFTQLKDVNLRKSLEAKHGLYLAESFSVISRALAAGHRPRSVLTSEHWLDRLQETLGERASDIPIFVAEDKQIVRLTGFSIHRGAIAAMERPALPELGTVLEGARAVLILEDLVDHTNVGAAIRSAAAMGFDAILTSPHCADPLYRRAVRVSMGTVFSLPWTRIDQWPDTSALKEHGFTVAGLALSEQAISLPDFCAYLQGEVAQGLKPKVALVLGTEGPGMSEPALNQCDQLVKIPLSHGVDSLNVAAAGAVACYAVSQALAAKPDRFTPPSSVS